MPVSKPIPLQLLGSCRQRRWLPGFEAWPGAALMAADLGSSIAGRGSERMTGMAYNAQQAGFLPPMTG
ncbi:MAG: hypothetical protein V5B36_12595 [Candidatus Accumulibacter sp. UW25]|jgi:hypothetical protein